MFDKKNLVLQEIETIRLFNPRKGAIVQQGCFFVAQKLDWDCDLILSFKGAEIIHFFSQESGCWDTDAEASSLRAVVMEKKIGNKKVLIQTELLVHRKKYQTVRFLFFLDDVQKYLYELEGEIKNEIQIFFQKLLAEINMMRD